MDTDTDGVVFPMSCKTANGLAPTVFIVDDDPALRCSLQFMLEEAKLHVKTFESAEEFLKVCKKDSAGCLLLDIRLKGMSGTDLQKKLARKNWRLPIIFMSAFADVPMVIEAIDAGVSSFIEKPFHREDLFRRVCKALRDDVKLRETLTEIDQIEKRFEKLTPPEFEIMKMIVSGKTVDEIATIFDQKAKIIDMHQESIFKKTGVKCLAELITIAIKSGTLASDEEVLELW